MAGQSTFSIFARMVLQDDQFKNQLNKQSREIRRQLKQQEKQWKEYGQAFDSVGKKMVTLFGGIGIAATAAYVKFEDKIATINTLLDDTSNLEGYKKAILDLGSQFGISSDVMADGMYQTISSIGDMGVETEKMFAIMAKSAKAGGAEVADSVALISAGMKGYGSVNEETAQKISDLAFQTAKLGVTTFPEMAKSMQPLFPLASTLNISLEDLFGSMATLTGVTGNTAEVSTQLKAVMGGLIKPTGDMQKLIEKYGHKSGAAMLKTEGLAGVLEILKKETGGNSEEFAKLFSSQEALVAILALTGEQYDSFIDKSGAMNKATGATNTAFGKLEETMKFKIEKAIVNVKNSFIKLGEKLAPVALSIIESVGNLADKFANLDDSTIENIANLLKWGAGLGVAFMAVGKVCTGIGNLNGFLANCNRFLTKNKGDTDKASFSLLSFLKKGINPTTLAIAGGAGLVVALAKWSVENEKVTKGIDTVAEKTKTVTKEVKNMNGELENIELNFSDEYKAELEKVTKYWEGNLLEIADYPTKLTKNSKQVITKNLNELKKYDKDYNAEVKKNRAEAMKEFEKENAELKKLSKNTYDHKKKDFEKTYDAAVEQENKIIDEITKIHEGAQKRGYYTEEDKQKLEELTEEMTRIAGAGLTKHLEDIIAFEEAKEAIYGKMTEKGKMLAEKKYNDMMDEFNKKREENDKLYADIKADYDADNMSYEEYKVKREEISDRLIENNNKLTTDQEAWLVKMRETYKHDEEAQKWLDQVEKNLNAGKEQRINSTVAKMQGMGFTKEEICKKMGISESEYTAAVNFNTDQQKSKMSENERKMNEMKATRQNVTNTLKGIFRDETVSLSGFTDQQVGKIGELIGQFKSGKINADELKRGIDNLKSKTINVNTNYTTSGKKPPAGYETGTVKRNAKGTEMFEGGLTWVGERGAELINLPRGTTIKNARASKHIDKTQTEKNDKNIIVTGDEFYNIISKYIDKKLGTMQKQKTW